MKCFVHVGLDPEPREAESAVEAIALAEKALRAWNDETVEEEGDDPPLVIRWRQEEMYPQHFTEYTIPDLLKALEEKGEVTLQLAAYGADGLPIMGEIVDIMTAEKEQQNNAEAEAALADLGKSLASMCNTKVTLISAGVATTFSKAGAVSTAKVAKPRKAKKTLKGRKPAVKAKAPAKASKKLTIKATAKTTTMKKKSTTSSKKAK